MKSTEFKAARQALGLTQPELAALLQAGYRSVVHWEAGDRDIPGPVQVLMRAIIENAEVRRYFGLSLRAETT